MFRVELVEVEDLDGDLLGGDTMPRNAGRVSDELQVNVLILAVFIAMLTENGLHDRTSLFVAREIESQLRTVTDFELKWEARQRRAFLRAFWVNLLDWERDWLHFLGLLLKNCLLLQCVV